MRGITYPGALDNATQKFTSLILLTSNHQTFAVSLRSDMSLGALIIVGLCSKKLMRLSYNIHLGFGESFLP